MQYAKIDYSHHAVHYSPRTYLLYHWKFVPLDLPSPSATQRIWLLENLSVHSLWIINSVLYQKGMENRALVSVHLAPKSFPLGTIDCVIKLKLKIKSFFLLP